MFVEKLTYGNAIKQIYIPDNGYAIFYRYIYDSSTWSDWQRIYPDYTSISLQNIGYIIFTNGLILQWTQGTYNKTTANSKYSYYQVQLPISFPNERFTQIGGITTYANDELGTTNISLEFRPDYGACICINRTVYDLDFIGNISGLWFGY